MYGSSREPVPDTTMVLDFRYMTGLILRVVSTGRDSMDADTATI